MFNDILLQQAADILKRCDWNHLKIATAESCTGGLVAALFTEIPGSSKVFERGFVTYSNASKLQAIGVDAGTLNMHGAVSEQVAIDMARKVRKTAGTEISIAITGVAGPGGGSIEKPVGLVYIAVSLRDELTVENHQFVGTRHEIRMHAVTRAITLLQTMLNRSFASVS